jgi:restriction system-associated AAA family ATPase
MKLLKLEIGDLPKEKQFRSLHAGFKVAFHSLDDKGIKAMETFSPFCFAGLNGSGKSNVLEALAAIFYHLECCVAKYRPQSFEKHFRPDECSPDAFTLEYLIGPQSSYSYILAHFDKITVTKKEGEAPQMTRQGYPFTDAEDILPVSLVPKEDLREPQSAPGKIYLPDIIVGYSSGENEILSLPFRKSRLINFDKYGQDSTRKYRFEEPENSLIYIDSEMSQAVLLVCLLYEDEQTLHPLKKELGILGIKSFRMNINDHFKEDRSFHRTHSLEHIRVRNMIQQECKNMFIQI